MSSQKDKPQEAESNTGMQKYYLASCVIFASLSIYSFIFYNNYNQYTCLIDDQTPAFIASQKLKSNQSSSGNTTTGKRLLEDYFLKELNNEEIGFTDLNQQNNTFRNNKYVRRILDQIKYISNKRKLQLTVKQQKALAAYGQPLGLNLQPGSSSTTNAFGMLITYGIQAFLSLFIYLGMVFFSRYLPTEIPNLNICFRLFGGIVRFFMNIQIKLHYVTLIQVFALGYTCLSDACAYNTDLTVIDQDGGSLTVSTDENIDANSLFEVLSIMWFLMHVIGGIIRSMVYIEPYYDIPEKPDDIWIMVFLFQRCGP